MADSTRKRQVVISTERIRESLPQHLTNSRFSDEITLFGSYEFLRRLLKNRKWLILGTALLVTLATAVQLFTVSPLYQSSATLQIDPDTGIITPFKDLRDSNLEFLTTEEYLQTQRELLHSETLGLRVIKRLDLRNFPAFTEQPDQGVLLEPLAMSVQALRRLIGGEDESITESRLLEKLSENLQIKAIPGTRLIEVGFTSPDPELSKTVVNSCTEEFIELTYLIRRDAVLRAKDFMEQRLKEVRVTLQKSEAELIQYAREKNILNIDQDQTITLQRFSELDKELTGVESRLVELQAKQANIRSATVDNFPPRLENDQINKLEERLNMLRQQLARLSGQFGPNWPETVQTRKELNEVHQQLSEERQKAIDEAKNEYSVSLQHYQLSFNRLQRQKVIADRLGEDLVKYNLLEREVQTNRELHEELLQHIKETSVVAAMDAGSVRIVERGRRPERPVWPKKGVYLAGSMLLGLFFGVGAALFLESVDDTLNTPEEAEKLLALDCLGIIPNFGKVLSYSGQKLLPNQANGQQKSLPAGGVADGHPSWEAYRFLRASLRASHPGELPKATMITSALPGEGKTTTAVNTSVALAESGAKTLLVDLNMRSPAVAEMFRIEGNGGISAFLAGKSNLHSQLSPTSIPNLYVLPAGPPPSNAAELISSDRIEAALGILLQFFDALVVDTPALLTCTDALVLSDKVDEVILVVRGGETSSKAVLKAVEHLRRLDAHLLGTVINAVDARKPEYAYDYGGGATT